MKIDAYSFGCLDVNGKKFASDVIYPDRVDPSWWRKEGHRLQIADLTDALNAIPQILIFGTGYNGRMAVPEDTKNHIRSLGNDSSIAATGYYLEMFNTLMVKITIIDALHLTC